MKSKEKIKLDFFKQFGNESFRGYPLEQCHSIWEFFEKYIQCQEDMAKLTFVPGLDKETLDELFDLHDDDDFIHEDSDKKYTDEDMINIVNKSRETGLTAEYLILKLNKQD